MISESEGSEHGDRVCGKNSPENPGKSIPNHPTTRSSDSHESINDSVTQCRIGMGIDFHRLGKGRPLILAGVKIEHELGLIGHSDADVLTHALCDALLGAAGMGDIGTHFPDTDELYCGIESLKLLERVLALLAAAGYRVVNVDATLIAQAPQLTPHFPAMRTRLTEALHLSPDRIGLKATTSEGMGAIGRCEGIGAICVCLIERD